MNAKAAPHPLTIVAPEVRFPVTICVLAYGPHAKLAQRFLESLYRNTDPQLFHLRAGLNEVEPATRDLFESHRASHGNIELFIEPENRFKSPLMRRLFYEPSLETEWMIWCDDDTHFRRADWLHRLAANITRHPNISVWGDTRKVRLQKTEQHLLNWIKAARWHRGLPPVLGRDENGAEAIEIIFAVGGFWAARTRMLQQLDWPDTRLVQAGDDFILGEAMRQNGFQLGRFTCGVAIDDSGRRNAGASEVRHLAVPH